MMRPRISLPLPVANGTTMVTGRAGQSCAAAGVTAIVEMSVATAAIILRLPSNAASLAVRCRAHLAPLAGRGPRGKKENQNSAR